MLCHIINRHAHKVEIINIDFPLSNFYLVESKQTITFANPMNLTVQCPTCKMQSFPGTTNTICPAREYSKYYYIEEYFIEEASKWCPCIAINNRYLEICPSENPP